MKFFAVVLLAVVILLGMNIILKEPNTVALLPELKISAYLQINEDNPDGYAFEPLELGVPRRARVGAGNVYNMCLYLDFDGGMVEVVSPNEDVQLSWNDKENSWRRDIPNTERTFGFAAHVSNQGYISFNPFGSKSGSITLFDAEMGQNIHGYDGREYELIVNAYETIDPETPVITARLRLTQLGEYIGGGSMYYSIELISYEMSEVYAMELAS